jgi:hypothetical protein
MNEILGNGGNGKRPADWPLAPSGAGAGLVAGACLADAVRRVCRGDRKATAPGVGLGSRSASLRSCAHLTESSWQLAVVGPLILGEVLAGSDQPEDLSSRGLEVQVGVLHFKYRDAGGDDFPPHFIDVVGLQFQVDRFREAAGIEGARQSHASGSAGYGKLVVSGDAKILLGGVSSFARYWTAAAISSFGSAVTAVAMPVLVVQLLGATPFEVGVVNAAQFVPYALVGLIVGVYTDRRRRKPVLVWASVGRALSLGAIPILWLTGVLQIWMLVIALLLFGASSVFGFAPTQSLLPRLVPQARLVSANARLDQTDAAAQTLGPAIGGGLGVD